MDYSSSQKYIQTQTLLNTINGQFQNLHVQDNRDKAGNVATPLSRSSSLLESLGINSGVETNLSSQNGSTSPFNSFVTSSNPVSYSDPLTNDKSVAQNESNINNTYNSLYGSTGMYGSNTPVSSFQTLTTPVGKSTIAAETYGFVNSFIAQPLWKYIDVQGNVQGPFSSSDMTNWYLQGYFQPSLTIYRVNDAQSLNTSLLSMCNKFFTLSELVIQTQSSQDPFNTFDSLLNNPQPTEPETEIVNPIPNHITNPLMNLAEKLEVDKKTNTESPKVQTQKMASTELPSLLNSGQDSEIVKASKGKKFVFKDEQHNDKRSPNNNAEATIDTQAVEAQESATSTKPLAPTENVTVNESVSSTSNSTAWTKIAAKNMTSKPVLKNQTSKNTIDPAKLRSVSSTPVAKTIGTPQTNPRMKNTNSTVTTTSKEEFLTWCKKNMKLNSGLSKANVVELLLSMPADVESEMIVAETIYSSSDVMDGRRFAKEFIKRRTECETQNDPLDWNEAIKLYIGNDDDDWEFQVVTKKKKN
ncbi:Protein SMY2 [Nakaseomyces bracarensis]|uniref:Protein SMY2 n=1 Tax=Nakaseomyces bracarensis TaxID=273131 RepID=A0ABR4P122_9SACH